MKKGTKQAIIAVVVIILILAIVWIVYESVKPEPVNISATNEMPNENMGESNLINETENDVTNVLEENELVNETVDEGTNEVAQNEETTQSGDDSEIISGTTKSREERAVELAKEYYEEEYGSTEGIYFEYDSIYEDGRYIVRAGTADTGTMYLYVNLSTENVSEE